MRKTEAEEKRSRKRPAVRIGRPPRELAGEVDDRILDAARHLFLERGLAGASVDEISRMARAGKPTIYARFPTKEALFAAVVARNGARVIGGFKSSPPTGKTVEERLISVGTQILHGLLAGATITFMRLAVAESRRFPKLGEVARMARERAAKAIGTTLSEVARSEEMETLPAFAPDGIEDTTRIFMDLVVGRLLMRALFGENLKSLRVEIDSHVARGVAFFLAACRRGSGEPARIIAKGLLRPTQRRSVNT
jgi:AcrR family transcriptional regulator